jgi:hypothetical protein
MTPSVTFWASLTVRSRRERAMAPEVVATTCGAAERARLRSVLGAGGWVGAIFFFSRSSFSGVATNVMQLQSLLALCWTVV